jgi:hypothetical protein
LPPTRLDTGRGIGGRGVEAAGGGRLGGEEQQRLVARWLWHECNSILFYDC